VVSGPAAPRASAGDWQKIVEKSSISGDHGCGWLWITAWPLHPSRSTRPSSWPLQQVAQD
jgi:hypothetical protein